VGSIGLVVAVPITTALAALVLGTGGARRVEEPLPAGRPDTTGRPAPIPAGPAVGPPDRRADDQPLPG
jgi:hypothetical protein